MKCPFTPREVQNFPCLDDWLDIQVNSPRPLGGEGIDNIEEEDEAMFGGSSEHEYVLVCSTAWHLTQRVVARCGSGLAAA